MTSTAATSSGQKLNLVLAHGYLGFRKFLGVEYFNGVAEYLTENFPVTVVETKVDPLKGVDVRGPQLRNQILVALGEVAPETHEERAIAGTLDPSQPVHLIAHSMGGLDCRYVLSPAYPDNLGDRIATLTTVATPHRGTPVVDVMMRYIEGVELPEWEKRFARAFRRIFKLFDISLEGLADLTTEWTSAFNEKYVDNPSVRYFSRAGDGRDVGLPTAAVMYPAWRYIHKKTGEVNDGAVPLSSAIWGEFTPDLWPADHPLEIGHDVNRCGLPPKHFDYLPAYGRLVEQLLDLE